MVWTIIVIILVVLDQASKIIVRYMISPQESISVIQGFFYLVHRVNTGAAWSLLSKQDWGIYLLIAISFFASIFILYMIYTVTNIKTKIALTLICSGSIGNLIDRLMYKEVTDFLDFHFGSYVFPTFNFADSMIVCGSIFLIISMLTNQAVFTDITFSGSSQKNWDREEP
jgi:signal peptidase II